MKNRLKEIRARNNYTQKQLAETLGISRQSLLSIEKGRSNPSLVLALRMAAALDTDINCIFFID